MRTAKQGSLDGLCGVYAIINAVDLIVRFDRGSTVPKELFTQLTYGLGAASILSSTIDGLDVFDLERAATLAFRWLSETQGEHLVLERPFLEKPVENTAAYLKRLRTLIGDPETSVIIRCTTPKIDHWSVLTCIESSTLILRDSDGLGTLEASDFQLDSGSARFWSTETLVIRRQPLRWLKRIGPRDFEHMAPPVGINSSDIEAAMDEMDAIGRPRFLKKYGATLGRQRMIGRGNKLYDAAAIEMAAAWNGEWASEEVG